MNNKIKKYVLPLFIILIISVIIAILIDDLNGILSGFIVLTIHYYIIVFIIHCFRKNKNSNDSKNIKLDPNYSDNERKKIYFNKGFSYEDACKNYCNQNNKSKDNLTEEDKKIIWDYSWDDFTYFLAWIIENNYYQFCEYEYGEDAREDLMKYIHEIKTRKKTPVDFLETTEGRLYVGEISEKIRNFILDYFDNSYIYKDGHYYLKQENKIGSYLVDLEKFAKEELNSEIYGFKFIWEDYDKFKTYIDEAYKKYKIGVEEELSEISTNDMQRIYSLIKAQDDNDFKASLNNISLYAFPLESNTSLLSKSEVAHTMISTLHHCFKAKTGLNMISENFLTSEPYKKLMFKFTDGFIFDELEKFDNYSEEELINLSKSNCSAYFYAYILGLIDKIPETPEECDEKALCSLITNFESYGEMLDNCKMLDKKSMLYIADSLCLETIYYMYKKHHNIPYDEKIKEYKGIQRSCSFYILSYDYDAIMKKINNLNPKV